MIHFQTCTEKELWEFVAVHLAKNGFRNVLVGGAVAAIYSDGIYKSGDLDLVLDSFIKDKSKLETTMNSIGFIKKTRHWIHPDCEHLYIEFCNPPVAIGSDHKIKPIEVTKSGIKIFILSPTDCVKDRLSAYIHWGARECLDQAILVAKNNQISLKLIKSFCLSESNQGKEIFNKFSEALKNNRS